MSTFQGFFDEIPYISADRFEQKNLDQSKLLFLSHCHADHMVGLTQASDISVPLYTSEISAIFLKKQYPNLTNIQTLEIECPTELQYVVESGLVVNLLVTAVPAQHCPGSVMFIFQTSSFTILYTGDFRLTKLQLKKYNFLSVQEIKSVYLDSTFLSEKYTEFPTQIESTEAICGLIEEWLKKNSKNKVVIEMPAQYGIEFLFISIGRKLKRKIYVHPMQWSKYIHLSDMDTCISQIEADCRISTKFKFKLENEAIDNKALLPEIRLIKPSAMYWSYWTIGDPIIEKIHDNEYRVAYSNHSSYNEIKDFLEFVKPKKVYLNVVVPKSRKMYEDCLLKIFTPTEENSSALSIKTEEENLKSVKFTNTFTNPLIKRKIVSSNNATEEPSFPPKRLKL